MSAGLSRTARHLLLLNLFALLVFGRLLHGRLNEWGGDNVTFLLLAEAIATGQGYVDLHEVAHPLHTRYPPLFPLLLAPLVGLGASLYLIKVFVAAFGLAALDVGYLYLARTRDATVALGVMLCLIVSGVFLDPVLSVMSDGPFLPLSWGALFLLDRVLVEREARPRTALAAGALIGLSLLMRMAGAILLPAAVATALLGRSEAGLAARLRRLALVLVGAGAVFAPWRIVAPRATEVERAEVVAVDGAGGEEDAPERERVHASYTQMLTKQGSDKTITGGGRSILDRPRLNLEDYRLRLPWLRPPPAFADAYPRLAGALRSAALACFFGLVGACALGGLVRLVSKRRVDDFYAGGTIALILIWIGGGPRLLVPVLPFLVGWVADGAGALAGLPGRLRRGGSASARTGRLRRNAVLTCLALVFALNALVTFGTPRMQKRLKGSPNSWWTDFQLAIDDVARRSGGEARVIAGPANVPYYLRRLPSVEVGWGLDGDARRDLARVLSSEPDYVVLTPFLRHHSSRRFRTVIERFPRRFPVVARYGEVTVHEVRPDAGEAGIDGLDETDGR